MYLNTDSDITHFSNLPTLSKYPCSKQHIIVGMTQRHQLIWERKLANECDTNILLCAECGQAVVMVTAEHQTVLLYS